MKATSFFVVSLFLGGCDLSLLEPEVEEALSHVYVNNIPERSGQRLRQSLIQYLHYQEPKEYTLSVHLEETLYGLALSNEARSRLNHITVCAQYKLVHEKSGTIVGFGTLAADNTFNILPSIQGPSLYYSTTIGEDYARQNIIRQLTVLLKNAVAKAIGAHLKLWKRPPSIHPSMTILSTTAPSVKHPLPVEPNPASPKWDDPQKKPSFARGHTTEQKPS